MELWVDDDALTEFLRIHLNQGIRIPIYDAKRFFDAGPLEEAHARLDYMKNVEGKSIIVFTLTDFEFSGLETQLHLKKLFGYQVDEISRIGINREQILHLPGKPMHLREPERQREEKLFQEQFGHAGCYSLHAIEPLGVAGTGI
jgi:hypothetical protein